MNKYFNKRGGDGLGATARKTEHVGRQTRIKIPIDHCASYLELVWNPVPRKRQICDESRAKPGGKYNKHQKI